MEVGKTSSSPYRVLHDTPEAFDGIEVMATMGREEMEAKLATVVVECRVELVRPMDTAAIDDHHDLFAGFTKGRHHLMDILAQLLGIKMGDDLIEDFRCSKLDGANHTEQHATGDAAPGAIVQPGMAFERLFPFDLTLAQWTCGQAIALGTTPPAPPRERKAPYDCFIGIKQDQLALAGSVFERRKVDRSVGQTSGGR